MTDPRSSASDKDLTPAPGQTARPSVNRSSNGEASNSASPESSQDADQGAVPDETSADPQNDASGDRPKISIRDANFWYGDTHALKGISMDIQPNQVTALIGPSGCGKSTLLRCMNRMNEMIQGTTLEGDVLVDGQDIYAENTDPVMVRRRVGMVFQKPNPFPKTIYKNVAWGATVNGYTGDMDALVEQSLRQAALWSEVKDRLHTQAYDLSGGQQQRLCIARTLAVQPDVVLMDEPASALDPIATSKVEATITELKKDYTIVIVTHNMQQASRISDETAFLYMGRLIEMNRTDQLFTRPQEERTEAYVTGRFG
jgi:phosphate transport system ATP-binding protein